jgi:hypothetical protein
MRIRTTPPSPVWMSRLKRLRNHESAIERQKNL